MTVDHSEEADASQRKVWLEVALNGPWGRVRQPGIPVLVSEIVQQGVECVREGAAIVSMQAYDEESGGRRDDWEIYARIIEGIRARVDVIVSPSITFGATWEAGEPMVAHAGFSNIEQLAKRGLMDWVPVEPGSTNFTHWGQLTQDVPGIVRSNMEEHLRHALGMARHFGLHPSYAICEPGFLRLGAGLHWRCDCPAPIYRFVFTSDYSFGFPPEDFAMTAYLQLLDRFAPGAQWMIGGLGAEILPLIPRAVMEGGHVRVGLEDAPFGTDRSNPELVAVAVERISNMGGVPATASEIRAALSVAD